MPRRCAQQQPANHGYCDRPSHQPRRGYARAALAATFALALSGVLPAVVATDDARSQASAVVCAAPPPWRLREHIAALVVVVMCGSAGVSIPLLGSCRPRWCVSGFLLSLAKFFGIGVIIATAVIQMLPIAHDALTDPCVGGFYDKYGAWASVFSLATLFILHAIEYIFSAFVVRRGSGGNHRPRRQLSVSSGPHDATTTGSQGDADSLHEEKTGVQLQSPPTPTSTLHELPTTLSEYWGYPYRSPYRHYNYQRQQQQQRQRDGRLHGSTSISSPAPTCQCRACLAHNTDLRPSTCSEPCQSVADGGCHSCVASLASHSRQPQRLSAMSFYSGTLAQHTAGLYSSARRNCWDGRGSSCGIDDCNNDCARSTRVPSLFANLPVLSTMYEGDTLHVPSASNAGHQCCPPGTAATTRALNSLRCDQYYCHHCALTEVALPGWPCKPAHRTSSRMSHISSISQLSRIASLYRHHRLPTISHWSSIGDAKPPTIAETPSVYGTASPYVWATPLLIEPRVPSEQHSHSAFPSSPSCASFQGQPTADTCHRHNGGFGCLAAEEEDPEEAPSGTYSATMCTLDTAISFHSVLVGAAIGVSAGSPFVSLLIAMSLHQVFEGFALGVRLVELNKMRRLTAYLKDVAGRQPSSRTNHAAPPASSRAFATPRGSATSLDFLPEVTPALIRDAERSTRCRRIAVISALAYTVTIPIGILVGICLHSSVDYHSRSALIMKGVLDSITAGILLYTGLTTLLAHEFGKPEFQGSSRPKQLALFSSMYLGVLLIAVVAIWS
ncbi:hypothetical protein EV182_001483 [Spiromyces aspiralis]|uniref:Uncharacterized protein n=1 Tax=Spiromyces aspiralis TaxID=68401 RepID=A0ACC1HTX3_9FUNG|nr:hypothetical protein EV182_001483 [Spiromyces aspiralis]